MNRRLSVDPCLNQHAWCRPCDGSLDARRPAMARAHWVAVVAGLAVMLAACAGAPPTDPGPVGALVAQSKMQTALGQEFQLRNTETAEIGSDGLTLRFDRVSTDARCPVGHPCESDGDAVVEITLHQAPSEAATLELHTDPTLRTEAGYLRYRIRLVRLDPRPVGEQPVPLPKYRGTFVVSLPQVSASSEEQ
ncbi:MAG: hypothetical protein ACRD1U_16770 [Vicinamibacterales bacterium]